MPTAPLPTYFAIPSAITGGPSINSQGPPEMYLGPDLLKASTLLVHWVLVILSTHSRGTTKKFLRRENIKGSRCSLRRFPKERLLVQRRHHVTYNTTAPHHWDYSLFFFSAPQLSRNIIRNEQIFHEFYNCFDPLSYHFKTATPFKCLCCFLAYVLSIVEYTLINPY